MEVKGSVFWFPLVLLLFYHRARPNSRMSGEFAFLTYFEKTLLVDNVDRVLSFLRLGWTTDDEVDHSVKQSISAGGVVESGEWCGAVSFSSVMTLNHVLRLNYDVSQLLPQLPRPLHRFYVG